MNVYSLASAHPADIDALQDDCDGECFASLCLQTPALYATLEGAKAAAQAEAVDWAKEMLELADCTQAEYDTMVNIVWRQEDTRWIGEDTGSTTQQFFFAIDMVEVKP